MNVLVPKAIPEATLIVWLVNLVLDFVPGPWQVTGKRRRRRQLRWQEPD